MNGCISKNTYHMATHNKIILTGGAGYIGAHLVVSLRQQGFTPVVVDDFSNATWATIHELRQLVGHFPVYQANCCHPAAVQQIFEQEGPIQGIVHLAAYKSVAESVRQPLKYYHNNLQSLVAVLQAAAQHRVRHVVFSSSAAVYGPCGSQPVTEEAPMGQAASPYAATKQQCEQLLAHFVACTPGLQAMALRYFNPIGAHPSGLIGENLSNSPDNLVPVITRAAAEVTGPLTVFGNDYPTPDGTCIRDFVHVCDLADAHVAALQYLMAQPCSDQSQPCHQVVNIGTGAGTSVRQLLLHFAQATGMAVPYRFGPRRPAD